MDGERIKPARYTSEKSTSLIPPGGSTGDPAMKLIDFTLFVPETTNLTIDGDADQALQLKTKSEVKIWMDQNGTWINQGDILVRAR